MRAIGVEIGVKDGDLRADSTVTRLAPLSWANSAGRPTTPPAGCLPPGIIITNTAPARKTPLRIAQRVR